MPSQDNPTRFLSHADGYYELGLFHEAWNELEKLDSAHKALPEVLKLRLRILVELKLWEQAAMIGMSVFKALPDDEEAVLKVTLCFHKSGKTDAAKNLLLTVKESFKTSANYIYLLARCEVQLGNIQLGSDLLKRSIEMDKKLKLGVFSEPDFEPIWSNLKSQS